jgi:hypothetical protein
MGLSRTSTGFKAFCAESHKVPHNSEVNIGNFHNTPSWDISGH